MAIYEVDGAWVCASGGMYLPGSYATRKACNIAFRKDAVALSGLWESLRDEDGCIYSSITEDQVRALPDRFLVVESQAENLC
jgi:hypothetical protein